jgi:hypothetical protein
VKYRPDKYVTRIKAIKAVPVRGIWRDDNVYFDTWAEAHAWLVRDRQKSVLKAEKVLKSAKLALAKVRKMNDGHAIAKGPTAAQNTSKEQLAK